MEVVNEHITHVEEEEGRGFYFWCSANEHGYRFREIFPTRKEAEAAAMVHQENPEVWPKPTDAKDG